RLFAADCAEAALLGERASGREPDERSWAAVDAARAFARGEIRSAARDARDAAWFAAAAAGRYARAAAKAAADAAAWATWDARDAARDAQYRRLRLYLEGAPIPPVEPLYGKETPGE